MPDQVRVDEAAGIIRIESSGEVTGDDVAGSIEQALQILSEQGFNKILVDTTGQKSMASTPEIFKLFSDFPREFILAMITEQSQVTAKDIAFAETVGVNRGRMMKVFHSEEEALLWLKQEYPDA
jgi:hypothetical protein